MNYGYECEGWPKDRKAALAADLAELCQQYPDSYGMRPYIEVDATYPGVRILRITHLTAEARDKLVDESDLIYVRARDAT